VDIASVAPALLRTLRMNRISMVFQQFALMPWRTIRENVGLGLELRGLSRQERDRLVNEKLALVHVPDAFDKMPSELSGGMKKRVGLARGLITDPHIILYDEPTAGLDPEIASSINHLIREIGDRLEVTALTVTHHIGTVKTVSDRVGLLDGGRLNFVSTPEEFLSSDAPRLVRFLGDRLD